MPKLIAEKLLYGGFALVRTDEGVVFVEGLLPGETGECTQVGKKGGIPFYQVDSVETTSNDRREPPCDYYGECGGCNWLHISYEAQLRAKQDIFDDALSRIGKLKEYPKPQIFSADEFGYRQRVQFKVDTKNEAVGFFKRSSNEVIPIKSCPLLAPALNKLLETPQDIITSGDSKRGCMMIDTGSSVLSKPVIHGKTESKGSIEVGDFTFQLKGDSFFQSNRFLTAQMASWCSEEMRGNRLLDLFGGVGLFSLFHGKEFKETVLVELSKPMARSAEKGFRKNGFTTGKALGMSSEQFFKTAKASDFDTVIVDPPRTGLSKEVRQGVMKLQPKQILYISCNPTTQARDLNYWVNEKGYRLVKTALFDLYPNSSHMESGAFLVRGDQ